MKQIILILLLCMGAGAATRTVPGFADHVRDAVNNADAGDTILVNLTHDSLTGHFVLKSNTVLMAATQCSLAVPGICIYDSSVNSKVKGFYFYFSEDGPGGYFWRTEYGAGGIDFENCYFDRGRAVSTYYRGFNLTKETRPNNPYSFTDCIFDGTLMNPSGYSGDPATTATNGTFTRCIWIDCGIHAWTNDTIYNFIQIGDAENHINGSYVLVRKGWLDGDLGASELVTSDDADYIKSNITIDSVHIINTSHVGIMSDGLKNSVISNIFIRLSGSGTALYGHNAYSNYDSCYNVYYKNITITTAGNFIVFNTGGYAQSDKLIFDSIIVATDANNPIELSNVTNDTIKNSFFYELNSGLSGVSDTSNLASGFTRSDLVDTILGYIKLSNIASINGAGYLGELFNVGDSTITDTTFSISCTLSQSFRHPDSKLGFDNYTDNTFFVGDTAQATLLVATDKSGPWTAANSVTHAAGETAILTYTGEYDTKYYYRVADSGISITGVKDTTPIDSFTVGSAPVEGNKYYIATTGNDNADGSISSPWQTVNKAFTTAKAGDSVFFRAGTYSLSATVETKLLALDGTSESPVVFKNYPGDSAVIDVGAYVIRIQQDNNIIDSLFLKGNATCFHVGYDVAVDHFTIKNCHYTMEVGGDNCGIVYLESNAKNVTVYNCVVTGPGLYSQGVHGNTAGVLVINSDSLMIRQCTFKNLPMGIYYKHGHLLNANSSVIIDSNFIINTDRYAMELNVTKCKVTSNIIGKNSNGIRIYESNGGPQGDSNKIAYNLFYGGGLTLSYDTDGGTQYDTVSNNIFMCKYNIYSISTDPATDYTVTDNNTFVKDTIVNRGITYTLDGWQTFSSKDANSIKEDTIYFDTNYSDTEREYYKYSFEPPEVVFAITQQPRDTTVSSGSPASFTVVATGANLTYQWQRNGANITGATSATLAFTAEWAMSGDSLWCIVSNNTETDTTDTVHLYVVTPYKKIVCVGNSIRRGWSPFLQNLMPTDLIPYDAGNHNGVDFYSPILDSICLDQNPDWVIINDGGLHTAVRRPDTTSIQDCPLETALMYANSIFKRIKEHPSVKRVIYITNTPVDENKVWFEDHSWQIGNADIQRYNTAMTALAQRYGFTVIDLYNFVDTSVAVFPTPVDGLHYTNPQYALIAEYIHDHLYDNPNGTQYKTALFGKVLGMADSLKDGQIRSDQLTFTGGSDVTLTMRTTSDRTGLIECDIRSIPAGSIIHSAKLSYRTYVAGVTNLYISKLKNDIEIGGTATPPTDNSPTYSHRKYTAGTRWTGGGNFSYASDCAAGEDTAALPALDERIELECTQIVQNAIDSMGGIFRCALRSTTTAAIQVHSADAVDEDNRPYLEIVYTLKKKNAIQRLFNRISLRMGIGF